MCGASTFTQGFVGIKYDCATPKAADQEFDNATMKLNFKKDLVTHFPSNYTNGGSSKQKTVQLLLGCSSDLKEAGKLLQAVAKQSANNQVEHPEAQIGHVELKQKSVVGSCRQVTHTHRMGFWMLHT